MAWLSLSIDCPASCVGELKQLLDNFGATAISCSPASQEPVFDDLSGDTRYWKLTRVTALLDPETDLDIMLACIRNRIGTENITGHEIGLLKDQDWEAAYQSGFGPVVVGDTLCICPGWSQAPPDIPCVIKLDPGLAFGTGAHETTLLCLEWLVSSQLAGKRMIDYGCGSGILGIAAAALGATQVIAVDIDAQALKATSDNAESNQLQSMISICSEIQPGTEPADLIVANILLETLLHLAPRFHAHLLQGGEIVLSGILANQVETCLAGYYSWFEMSDPVFKSEWAMLKGVKKPS